MKKILVLGGTSSLAAAFFQRALADGYEITATTRNLDYQLEKLNLKWEYLDLDLEQSIFDLIDSLNNVKFDLIIDFIGKTSKSNTQMIDLEDLEKYFKSQVTNHVFLLLKIQELLSFNGALINLSSRSVEYGSFDIPYAASKAAIHNSFFSIKNKLSQEQKVINLISGLIIDSTMYKEMSSETILNHQNRADSELITVEEFTDKLIEICRSLNTKKIDRYSLIKIGPDYE